MFSDKNGMERLFSYLTNTTTDPVTKRFYKDCITSTVWIPIRWMIEMRYYIIIKN